MDDTAIINFITAYGTRDRVKKEELAKQFGEINSDKMFQALIRLEKAGKIRTEVKERATFLIVEKLPTV